MSDNNQTVRIISVSPTVNSLQVFLGRETGNREIKFRKFMGLLHGEQGTIVRFRPFHVPRTNSHGILESMELALFRANSIQVTLDTHDDRWLLSGLSIDRSSNFVALKRPNLFYRLEI